MNNFFSDLATPSSQQGTGAQKQHMPAPKRAETAAKIGTS